LARSGVFRIDTDTQRQHGNLQQHQQISSVRDSSPSTIELVSIRGQDRLAADSRAYTGNRQHLD
jgi:hypothetical protein